MSGEHVLCARAVAQGVLLGQSCARDTALGPGLGEDVPEWVNWEEMPLNWGCRRAPSDDRAPYVPTQVLCLPMGHPILQVWHCLGTAHVGKGHPIHPALPRAGRNPVKEAAPRPALARGVTSP